MESMDLFDNLTEVNSTPRSSVFYSCFDDDLNSTHVTPERWQTTDRGSGLATAVVLLVFMVIGVPCNLLIIVSMLWKKLYRQPAHILLLNLAINDLLMCVTYIPINIVSAFAGEFIFGTNDVTRCHVCQIGVVLVVFSTFNLHIIALMSLDRFLFFKYPLRYPKLVTVKSTALVVVVLWIFCILVSLPPLFGFGEIRFTQSISTCTLYLLDRTDVTYNIFYEVFAIIEGVVIPIPVLLLSMVGVVCIVCRQLNKTYGEMEANKMAAVNKDAGDKMHKIRNKKQLHVAKLYGAILLSNMATWTPNILNTAIIFALCKQPFSIPHGFFTSNYIFFLSSVWIHPLLQAYLIPDIRRTLIKLFRKRPHPSSRKPRPSSPPTLGNGLQVLEARHVSRGCCGCGLVKKATPTPSVMHAMVGAPSSPCSSPTLQ